MEVKKVLASIRIQAVEIYWYRSEARAVSKFLAISNLKLPGIYRDRIRVGNAVSVSALLEKSIRAELGQKPSRSRGESSCVNQIFSRAEDQPADPDRQSSADIESASKTLQETSK